jgi:ribosomal protein S18 acetylase RimI-like enzyme
MGRLQQAMKPELRPACAADYAFIAAWVPDAAACLRWAGPRVPFPFAGAELATHLAVTGGESHCLAEPAAAPCGFGQHWAVSTGAVHLGRIIVAPSARGQGLGYRLCVQLIARAIQATGAGAVTLRVYRDNAVALGLYTRLGFSTVATESNGEVFFMRKRVP